MTTAAGFTIPRAFFRALPRGRIHRARIIALRLAAAIGARHFVRVHFHQLFKTLSASRTFILQKRHTCHPTTKLPFYYTRKNVFWQVFSSAHATKPPSLVKSFQKIRPRPPPSSQKPRLGRAELPFGNGRWNNTVANRPKVSYPRHSYAGYPTK